MNRYARHLKVALTIWAVTLAPLGLAYLAVVRPQDSRLEQLRSESKQKRHDFLILSGYRSQQTTREIQGALDLCDTTRDEFVARADGLGELDFRISQIAQKSRLGMFSSKMLSSGTVASMAKLKHVGERDMKVSFEADFISFVSFLNELERHSPVVLIDQFTFIRDPDHKTSAMCDVELAVLYQKDQPESR